MGPVLHAMLLKYWLTLIGIGILVVTLFMPRGADRNWLLLLAFLLVMTQTGLNALRAQRRRSAPDEPHPDV